MPQYALSLSLPPVFSADNFFISGCNRDAWQWIQAWPNWATPGHALLLYGPHGSGKSHLGAIWAARSGARVVSGASMPEEAPGMGHVLIEDIERATDEKCLLHWFNYTRENGGSMLMTSAVATQSLPFTLPDLASRLMALPQAHIAGADDEALAGAMRKQFADRQMKVEDGVIAYALPRVERSFAKIRELVELLDSAALAERKNITVPFVKRMLDQWQNTALL